MKNSFNPFACAWLISSLVIAPAMISCSSSPSNTVTTEKDALKDKYSKVEAYAGAWDAGKDGCGGMTVVLLWAGDNQVKGALVTFEGATFPVPLNATADKDGGVVSKAEVPMPDGSVIAYQLTAKDGVIQGVYQRGPYRGTVVLLKKCGI